MGIIDSTKELAKLAQQIGNIEVYNQVIGLQGQVMELLEENIKSKTDLQAAKEELRKARDNSELAKNLDHDGERYWLMKDGKREGPYCHICWDIDTRLVRMRGYIYDGRKEYVCDYCSGHRNRAGR